MTGADLIAGILKQENVEFMGCIPFNSLEEAAAKIGIRPMIFRQERVGVNLADGFSRVSNRRRIGVFSMQAGAGVENAFAGVAQAYADSSPILLLAASVKLDHTDVAPNFSPTRSYRDVTKWVAQVNMPNRIPELMRRAFSNLKIGRPGPVMIDIPSDILRGEVKVDVPPYTPVKPHRSSGDPQDVRDAAKALCRARRPMIHAGQGVLYADASEELIELAELVQAPVMTTLSGKSCFPENHPLSIGSGGMTTTGPVVHFLKGSDMVFGIGCSFSETAFGVDIPSGKAIVHCTNDEEDVNKEYQTDHVVIGDAKLVLQSLISEVKGIAGSSGYKDNGDIVKEIKSIKDVWMQEWAPLLNSDETPINPYRVVRDLAAALDPTKSIVTHDSGSSRDEMTPFFETISPRGFIGWGKSTQLGYGLGLAFGAKMAEPEKTVVNIMGDYAFGMVGLDIETAVREQIPIITIVMNNSVMGIYEPSWFPTANEIYNTKYTTGDYALVAEALGCYNEKVTKPDQIIPAIQRAKNVTMKGHPAFIEILTKEERAFSYRKGSY